MTPFEKLGYTPDTELLLTEDVLALTVGTIVTLDHDDGSNMPRFNLISEPGSKCWVELCKLIPATPEDRLRILTFGTLREY